ncbi:precorrin-3B C(17)-methyltransferase [Magnetospirillum gryphiswaldense]|uniref:precorrin-3B C(17)-methyltransferase n=1 Tax=Magnetospirillum gryphiswaldense TaxID=55518 RepID=UPI000D0436D2|nr:precorrin-3B C(17)-methyltransferase [Magnetospirillum gryphiswaldense]AVM75423.1 Precorrin-3B C(17)-methyltransferase [Magnetospirillum gryphiswaldense MSR-1]AVM79326.1 Precorrin-3B C(17)-methyltransferase [Magnetospirillum gryphiswaldense]
MIAVLCVTPAALATARTIVRLLPEAELHGLSGRIDDAPVVFSDTKAHIGQLFKDGHSIIGVCAAGILIRAIGPHLLDKQAEPAVVAVAPDGSSAVPLLGGHHGANELARRLAEMLGGHAAITTAGDLKLGVALDEPPPGWHVANPAAAKPVAAALLAGEPVRLEVEAGDADWLSHLSFAEDAEPSVRVTDHAVMAEDRELLLNPPVLALGVGCERDCDPAELAALVRDTLEAEALAPGAIACIASVDLKIDERAVLELARSLGVPARFFTAARLNEEAPRLKNPSDIVLKEIGCPGVAEGAALAAAGPEAELVVPKTKSKRATLAIARAPHAIDPARIGRAPGRLFVVGIGPGTAQWRTPQASAAIAAASDLVGYGLYLDLLGEAAAGKTRHQSDLGAEADRARMALDLAGQGKSVALVCSGDAGIYALATLVFELIEREANPVWRGTDILVIPGVSALQAAAARAGAPVNHDFCTISLSDLLTPWETIEKRLHAAAEADFVVCFYNPVSKRRRDQLTRARDILLTGRPAETPVILARQLGRPEEHMRIIALGDLTADDADMLTMVVVGSSESRRIAFNGRDWVYTPRGYAKKL